MLDTLAQEEMDIFDNAAGTDPAVLFAAAYRTFAGPVQGYLRARGLDDPEAVTQDVFLAFDPRIGALTGGLAGVHFQRRARPAGCLDCGRSRSGGRSPD